ILNYCTALLHLSPEQVIAIFNNNFNELRRFLFGCRGGFDANIKIRMVYENPWNNLFL
ncbi:10779_t:CDS:1, partial [Diversispora eburnea]